MKLYAALTLLGLTLLSLLGLLGLDGHPRLRIDHSMASIAADSGKQNEQAEGLFVLLEVDQQWRSPQVESVDFLVKTLERIQGVSQVDSPFTSPLATEYGLRPLLDLLAEADAASDALITRLLDDPMIAGHSASKDGKGIVISIQLQAGVTDSVAIRAAVQNELDVLLKNTPLLNGHLSGPKMIESAIAQQLQADLKIALGISLAMAFVLVLACFKGPVALILPFGSMSLALVWTSAAMATLDIPITLLTGIVAPLVIALSLAYSMHGLFALTESSGNDASLKELLVPFVITGFCTVGGLLALAIQPLPAIAEFSVGAAFGALNSVLAVLAIVSLMHESITQHVKPRPWLRSWLNPLATRSFKLSTRYRFWVIAVSVVLLIIGAHGATQLKPGGRYVSDLPDSHSIRHQLGRMSARMGGSNHFDIVLQTNRGNAMTEPHVVQTVEQLQTWLEQQPDIGASLSLVDQIKYLHRADHGGAIEQHRLPDSMFQTSELLMRAPSGLVDEYSNQDFSRLVIHTRTTLDDVAELNALFKHIKRKFATELPPGIYVHVSGESVYLAKSASQLVSSQFEALGLALLTIYLILSAVFASWQMGLRTMLPNLVPVAVFYGLFGLSGAPMSPAMAMVACIVLSIAVHDTVFFLVRYNKHAHALGDEHSAAKHTLHEVIRPVTLTTIAICACFLSLAASPFASTTQFAILATLTLIAAWITDLLLTPIIGVKSGIVTIWDLLTLDLGEAPQANIPLFSGLSNRQARLFALLTNIKEFSANQLIIRQGDDADEMYLVIDGEASAFVEDESAQTELANFKRGDVFGEQASFIKVRTANVRAITDLRVLAFDFDSLERIRRKNPAIASLIYRNLNTALSEKLSKTTSALLNAQFQQS